MSPRRVLVGGLVVVAMAFASSPALARAPHARSAAVAACPGADVQASTETRATVERAVVCVVNRYRKREGRAPLRVVATLRAAALSHARRMVDDHFLSHTDPDGATLVDRLETHRYVSPRTRSWVAAENIGVSGGPGATATHIVRNWMGSPEHRANLMRSKLRDIGVGVVEGAPYEYGSDPVTIVADLGTRS